MIGTTLTILSWNLALFERSEQAPTYWGQSDVEAAARQDILDLAPDIVAYQELPGLVPFVETHDMIRANPRTHSGNLATLVSHDLMATKPSFSTVDKTAVLTTFDQLGLTVANVHLAPGKGSAGLRLDQLAAIQEANPSPRLVIVGDTNTRVEEETGVEDKGLTAPRPPGPTWDGHRNRFRGDSGRFRAYFTRAMTSGPVTITDQRLLDVPRRIDGQEFHLSDHFALIVEITIS